MNTKARITLFCLAVAAIAVAAKVPVQKRLTPQRIAELSALAAGPQEKTYSVEISGLEIPGSSTGAVDKQFRPIPAADLKKTAALPARVTFPAKDPKAVIEVIREFRYPIAFEPPQAAPDGTKLTAPTTPAAFETTNTGWTIRMSAKPSGNYVALSGMAEYTEAELLNGGYGAFAGPIQSEKGELISPNVLHQPKFKTTSTRFFVFAVPGETYEVTFYRGDKAETHAVKVVAE